jgi:hypothetical protein
MELLNMIPTALVWLAGVAPSDALNDSFAPYLGRSANFTFARKRTVCQSSMTALLDDGPDPAMTPHVRFLRYEGVLTIIIAAVLLTAHMHPNAAMSFRTGWML